MEKSMETLEIESGKYIPRILFDCEKNILEISGKSYPENAANFFEPVIAWLEEYVACLKNQKVVFTVELTYFNSSTARALTQIFNILDNASKTGGKSITINWIYNREDDTILEYGEEYGEDIEAAEFKLVPKD